MPVRQVVVSLLFVFCFDLNPFFERLGTLFASFFVLFL